MDRLVHGGSVALLAVAIGACVGEIGGSEKYAPAGGPGPDPAAVCETIQPGVAPLRRLNRTEYRFTVQDLFGVTSDPSADFPAETIVDGFDNNANSTSISQLRADKMFAAAEAIGAATTEELTQLLPCDVANVTPTCVDELIETVGRRSYRRPLEPEESAILRVVYDADPSYPLRDRVSMVLQAILMAPQFHFRVEEGNAAASPSPGVLPLTGYEVASRLSYLLWASAPDDVLLDAAAAGGLDTVEGVEAEARRMLEDDRAHRGVANFVSQWLDLRGLDLADKDPTVFPDFDPELIAAMRTETEAFFESVIWEKKGGIHDLLLSNETLVDARLAAIYGVSHPGDASWQSVTLPDAERRGVLTQASFLTNFAHRATPAPVRRGHFVRSRLLCQDLDAPPNDVDTSVPPPSDAQTNRELLAQHSADPLCKGCHQFMDPIGFGFEKYDAIGQFRTVEGDNLTIDATGELVGTTDSDGPFDGAIELAERLAESDQVQQCMTTQAFRYTYGRRNTADDSCTVDDIQLAHVESGGAILELLVAITRTDSFRFRTAAAEGN